MKKIFLTVLTTLGVFGAFAQTDAGSEPANVKQQNRHEIWLGGGGGISSLQYSPSKGNHEMGFGYLGNLSYTYYFNYHWGISIGGEYQYLQAKYNSGDMNALGTNVFDQYLAAFPGSTDVFAAQIALRSQWKERQEATYVNVPLLARYQFDFPGKNRTKLHKFVFSAGLKVGIPLKGYYYASGNIETSGLDYITRDEYTNMPTHGFSNYTYDNYKLEWKGKLNFIGTLEAGVKWQFGKKWGLYTGLFADLGVNDIVKERQAYNDAVDRHFIEYNPSGWPNVVNSVMYADYGAVNRYENGGVNERTAFAKCVTTMSAGVKIAVTFGWKPFNKKEKVVVVPPPVYEDPWEKPVTGYQMRELLNTQTTALTEAQRAELEKLKEFLSKEEEEPDLSAPIYCFEFDKDNIPDNMKAVLDKKAALLKEYPKIKLIIEGHTDYAGSDQYNYDLGLSRADAVKHYLVSKGINGNRLTITSKGRKEPIVKNKIGDIDGNCQNRRVEFLLK